MKKEQAEFICDALAEDGHGAEIIEGYSGRGMYGETTYAVRTDCDNIIPSLMIASAYNHTEILEGGLFDDFKLEQDQLGLGIVLY